MNKLILLSFVALLAGCHSTQRPRVSTISLEGVEKSSCTNCTLKPFYVDGHWVEGRD